MTGRLVVEIVGQVGADDPDDVGSADHLIEHVGYGLGRHIPGRQRERRELTESDLEEGKLHLEAVLAGVGGRSGHHDVERLSF